MSNNTILVPAIGILFVASAHLASIRGRASTGLLLTIGIVVVAGTYGSLIGHGNPGLLYGILVWVIAPVMFGTFAAAGDERMLRWILKISAWTTVFTSLFAVIYVAGEAGGIPIVFSPTVVSQMGAGFSYGEGSIEIGHHALTTLVAAAPIWLTACLLPRHRLLPSKRLSLTAGSAALAATIVSGRVALIVLTAVVPVAVWILWRIVTRSAPRSRLRRAAPFGAASLGLMLLVLLASVSGVVARTWGRVSGTLTGQYFTEDDRIRGEEATELLRAWREAPLFGQGWGATINGYSRDDARHWNFELQYHMILFQVGILGALVLLVAIAVGVATLVIAVRRQPEMLPVALVVTAGALSMLIANGSNPYLQAPGNMWSVYLVLMIANMIIVDGAPEGSEPARKGGEPWPHRLLGSTRPATPALSVLGVGYRGDSQARRVAAF